MYTSPASQKILGCSPEALVGRSIMALMHPHDRSELAKGTAPGEPLPAVESAIFRLRHADGQWVWLEASLRPIRESTGELVEVQGVMRDVTRHMDGGDAPPLPGGRDVVGRPGWRAGTGVDPGVDREKLARALIREGYALVQETEGWKVVPVRKV